MVSARESEGNQLSRSSDDQVVSTLDLVCRPYSIKNDASFTLDAPPLLQPHAFLYAPCATHNLQIDHPRPRHSVHD